MKYLALFLERPGEPCSVGSVGSTPPTCAEIPEKTKNQNVLGSNYLQNLHHTTIAPQEPTSVAAWTPRRPPAIVAEIGDWPVRWRERWGELSNQFESEGVPFPESEQHAYYQVKAEQDGRKGAAVKAGCPGLEDSEMAPAIDLAFASPRMPFATGLELWRRRDRLTGKYGPDGTEPTETWLTLAAARDVRRGDRWLPWHFREEAS
jgi:hypothetical protein